MAFPYYIVRFKLCIVLSIAVGAKSFHTTQYDLNPQFRTPHQFGNFGFHTTQYDLNHSQNISSPQPKWFPYYIVRFKPLSPLLFFSGVLRFHTTQYDLNKNYRKSHFIIIISFHTTQYDLNIAFEGFWRRWEQSFHTTQYDLNPNTNIISNIVPYCFHTTQYDLNFFIIPQMMTEKKVSILHSTI